MYFYMSDLIFLKIDRYFWETYVYEKSKRNLWEKKTTKPNLLQNFYTIDKAVQYQEIEQFLKIEIFEKNRWLKGKFEKKYRIFTEQYIYCKQCNFS